MPKLKSPKRVRGVYGGTLSKRQKITMNGRTLRKVAECLVKHVSEASIEAYEKWGRTPRGKPMALPNTDNFFKSFSWRIKGDRTIEILCSWPWVLRHLEGRDPFPMEWLTQEKGMDWVPMRQEDGSVVVVRAPATVDDAWIHPGVEKIDFLSKGLRKGRKEAKKLIAREAAKKAIRATFK